MSQKRGKMPSFLSSNPTLTKRISSQQLQKLPISEQQFSIMRNQLYQTQQKHSSQLKKKVERLSHENEIFRQSLMYFDAQLTLQELQQQLQRFKQEDRLMTEQITQCQMIEKNTTPEEYFLFKKNKRLETFNQAIDSLFEQVNKQKQQLSQYLDQIKIESSQIINQIAQMKNQLQLYDQSPSSSPGLSPNRNSSDHSSTSSKQQSRINMTIESNFTERQANKEKTEIDSDSGSSVDLTELQALKQEYKDLLQTYERISQNNEIMTTQLLNNVETIESGLNKFFESQRTKLFKEINQLKEDFSFMPQQHVIKPSEQQLSYKVDPLIQDYKNKLIEISKKLSPDLKSITAQILSPLPWESINFEQYFEDSSEIKRSTTMIRGSGSERSAKGRPQIIKLQEQIKDRNNEIMELQSTLKNLFDQAMIYKEKHTELELAINNMRKMIRGQQNY